MVKGSTDRISEFQAFLSQFRISDPLSDKAAATSFLECDREFFALLLWGLDQDIYAAQALPDAKVHLRESLSDIASSIFCTVINLNKPAMMALRSAVENFVKFVILNSGADISDTKSTYELNDRFRLIFATRPVVVRYHVGNLLRIYSDLCMYVHSASPDFMNIDVAYRELLSPNPEKYKSALAVAENISKSMSAIILSVVGSPSNLHHKQVDYILDRLPRTLKRATLGD